MFPLPHANPLSLDLSQFPIRDNLIYCNHAGTAPITRAAANMLKTFADEASGHASTVYDAWTKRMEETRAIAARLVGSDPSEIAFTKSTTAGLNLVATGIDWKKGDVVVVEEKTFPANWYPWKIAEKRGATLWFWPERDGRYDIADLEARLQQGGVRLVAATSANFATGYRADLEAIGALCAKHHALHCVDAIQTLGVFPIDVRKCHIDFLSADSHKWLMGPEGAAIFYCAKDKLGLIDDTLVGWYGREAFWNYDQLGAPPDRATRRFEEGAPNVAGVMAMGESLKVLAAVGIDRISVRNRTLCRILESGFAAQGWTIISPRDEKNASSIVSTWKQGIDPTKLAAELWKQSKVWVVSRRGYLRVSPHFYQSEAEMEFLLEGVKRITA
ncbi:aminotransferase class V-fold PLP-dependent enzyme [Candidatus Sumerlaeota bacterium]|nr:aminotransferase class V-fold PLP-dependent enzyme [Candidatus Sumerlaeota bacterium]